jgi:hypothetical protein
MAMKGWRRIGIILSVIWFLGFGVFLWRLLVDELVATYSYSLQNCRLLEDSANNGLQYFPYEKREKRQAEISALDSKCRSDAKLEFDRTLKQRGGDGWLAAFTVIYDLISIALGWLIVWGCVALGRWVHRGFTTA